MSEFNVRVVRLTEVEKHGNADTLNIAWIDGKGGYPCIFKIGDFKQGDLAVYIPVDAIVPDLPQYAFLNGHTRIKAKRLRGVFSMGLLQPLPPGNWNEGDNVQEVMGIKKYEPMMERIGKHGGGVINASYEERKPPAAMVRYTDLDPLRKYGKVLVEGEEVVIVEKIHGCNARFLFTEGRLWVGSHNRVPARPQAYNPTRIVRVWSKIVWNAAKFLNHFRVHSLDAKAGKWREKATPRPAKENTWWSVADKYRLEDVLREYEDLLIFGEVFGSVQDLHYGVPAGENQLAVFDMYDLAESRYLNFDEMNDMAQRMRLPVAPLLYRGPWFDNLRVLAEGETTVRQGLDAPGHVREGFVVRPVRERTDPRIGRVVLKHVGEGYLLRP